MVCLAGMVGLPISVWLYYIQASYAWQSCCAGAGSWRWSREHCSLNVCWQNFFNRFYVYNSV